MQTNRQLKFIKDANWQSVDGRLSYAGNLDRTVWYLLEGPRANTLDEKIFEAYGILLDFKSMKEAYGYLLTYYTYPHIAPQRAVRYSSSYRLLGSYCRIEKQADARWDVSILAPQLERIAFEAIFDDVYFATREQAGRAAMDWTIDRQR